MIFCFFFWCQFGCLSTGFALLSAGFLREKRRKIMKRKRDDNKNKICAFQGGGGQGGREENCPKRYFSWETPRQ